MSADAGGVSPTEKVIQMLNDMLTKSQEEKHDEAVRYAEFEQFCAGTKAVKTKSIEKAETVIGKVNAEIDSLSTEIDQLDADITKADSDIAVLGAKIQTLGKKVTERRFRPW